MKNDREFDEYLNHLDSKDQQRLNAYMDNLDLEDNPQLDAYLDQLEEQQNAGTQYDQWIRVQPSNGQNMDAALSYGQGADTQPADVQSYGQENGLNPSVDGAAAGGQNSSVSSPYEQGSVNLRSYIELEPEIESFQDYTTARMQPVNPEDYGVEQSTTSDTQALTSAGQSGADYSTRLSDDEMDLLQVSLLDTNYETPMDTLRYKDMDSKGNHKKDRESRTSGGDLSGQRLQKKQNTGDFGDDIFYIDNAKKTSKAPVIAAVIVILLMIGGGAFAAYHFTDGFDFIKKQEPATEITTELKATTEEVTTEEATTEEQPGPYATVDYILHDPHATDSTIVFDSNPYSLKNPPEEWPVIRNDNGDIRDATQEELYPVIDLTAVEGSLNYTNPDPSNPLETQQMYSRYMVLVDLSDDSIVAKRDSDVVVNPASMTKILTVLTAADLIEDLDDTFVMTSDAIQYAYDHDCSAVGFLAGEKVTVRDLIYGTIVCSGADAAVGLAQYCCGSQDAFVEKMNEKAEELGISDTAHFTNVVGVYDENLHCTMEDMAVILSTAVQNELLYDVLNTRIYQTTADPTILPEEVRKELGIEVEDTSTTGDEEGQAEDGGNEAEGQSDGSSDAPGAAEGADGTQTDGQNDGQSGDSAEVTDGQGEAAGADGQTDGTADNAGQPEGTEEATTEEIDPGVLLVATEGIQISNWFMRRIEDKDTGGEVLGAKTGFVNAAGFCCASYYRSNSGKEYICVTGDAYSSWRCIYDHVGIYRSLAK